MPDKIFLDTNILVYLANEDSPFHLRSEIGVRLDILTFIRGNHHGMFGGIRGLHTVLNQM